MHATFRWPALAAAAFLSGSAFADEDTPPPPQEDQRPPHSFMMRVGCSSIGAVEAALRRGKYSLVARGIDREGDVFMLWRRANGQWSALSLITDPNGKAMGCPLLSGDRMPDPGRGT